MRTCVRRRRSRTAEEGVLSLVPMADMLTNTVGIMLFIMAFTILASAGAAVLRTLPKETVSQQSPVFFVCVGQRVLPLDRAIASRLVKELSKPTYSTIDSWLAQFHAARYEDAYFVVRGQGRAVYDTFGRSAQLQLTAKYTPKAGAGDDMEALKSETSDFARALEKQAGNAFAYFIVYPDSIDVFRQARQVAADAYRMSSGWSPQGPDSPITISLTGGQGGINPEPQSK